MAQTVKGQLGLLVSAQQVINGIDDKLPLRLAVKVGRVQKALDEWVEPFQERQRAILETHLEEGESEMRSDHPKWNDFVMEINALMLEETDIEVDPLTVDELEDAVELSPAQARVLFDAGLLTD